MTKERNLRGEKALAECERQYARLKARLVEIGFVLQGSVTERRMRCGRAGCHCQRDPKAMHGPYYQWSWKIRGKTKSVYLEKRQADRCKAWTANNRELERIIKEMRALSWRMARLQEIAPK